MSPLRKWLYGSRARLGHGTREHQGPPSESHKRERSLVKLRGPEAERGITGLLRLVSESSNRPRATLLLWRAVRGSRPESRPPRASQDLGARLGAEQQMFVGHGSAPHCAKRARRVRVRSACQPRPAPSGQRRLPQPDGARISSAVGGATRRRCTTKVDERRATATQRAARFSDRAAEQIRGSSGADARRAARRSDGPQIRCRRSSPRGLGRSAAGT